MLITILIYPVIVHWVWSAEGWLSASNADAFQGGVIAGPDVSSPTGRVHDTSPDPRRCAAGSGVVHLTGGTAGLCGAVIIATATSKSFPRAGWASRTDAWRLLTVRAIRPVGCVVRLDVSRRCAPRGSQRLGTHGRCRSPCRSNP